jgi:hypothetical protein
VVPGRTDASLKLRGGKLELKVLRGRKDGLELWEPAAETEFPVAPDTLQAKLLGPAGVALDLPGSPIDRDLLLALARAAPGTRAVRVDKHRRRYRIAGATAEFTRLSVDGSPVESIAIEEADRQRAIDAVAALCLADRQNSSYQRFLVGRFFPRTLGGADA